MNRKTYGGYCRTSSSPSDCDTTLQLTCSSAGICVCASTYWYAKNIIIRINFFKSFNFFIFVLKRWNSTACASGDYGTSCTANSQCASGKGLLCISNSCACETLYIYNGVICSKYNIQLIKFATLFIKILFL